MTDFVQFLFNSTGGSNPRKMPDRLADITNVKDWILGTDPDATNGIQKAVNHAQTIGGGIVFIPSGIYIISQPISCGGTTNAPVQIIGEGKASTQINNASSGYTDPLGLGYTFSGGYEINAFDNLERVEAVAASVRLTRQGASAISVSGTVNAASAKGGLIYNCTGGLTAPNVNTWPGPPGMPGTVPGSVNFAIGTGVIDGCRGVGGPEVAYALSGYGSSCVSSSFENCGAVVRVGWAFPLTWSGSLISSSTTNTVVFSKALPGEVIVGRYVTGTNIPGTTTAPTTTITVISSDRKTITLSANTTGAVTSITFAQETPCIGGAVQALETERIYTGIEMYNCSGILVAGNTITADDAGPGSVIPFTTAPTYSGGLVHVTIPSPSSYTTNPSYIALGNDNPTGFVNSSWVPVGSPELIVTATWSDSTHFTYPLASAPSAWTAGTGDGWCWPPQAHMRFRKWKNCMVTNNAVTRAVYLCGYDFDYSGQSVAGGSNVFMANDADRWGYIMPTNAATLASIKYLNQSQTTGFFSNQTGLAVQYLNPFVTFAQLPGQPGVLQPGPYVGQEYVITDGPASVSFRQNISVGGGSGQVKVRYGNTGSGNAWIACG